MTRISPASGQRSPITHSTVVVFPAPFGPKMPKISPPRTEGETSSTATVARYILRDADFGSGLGFGNRAWSGRSAFCRHGGTATR